MKSKEKIVGTEEAWENGQLGRDAEHATPAPRELAQQVDDALGHADDFNSPTKRVD